MTDYYFQRECRTPYSESYAISDNSHPVGRVELHFTSSVVHATVCTIESLTREDIQELIGTIDQELAESFGIPRDEFVVHVYQGRETEVFGADEFSENGEQIA